MFVFSTADLVVDYLLLHRFLKFFSTLKTVDELFVHPSLKYFEHEKGGQTNRPHHFVQILRPFKMGRSNRPHQMDKTTRQKRKKNEHGINNHMDAMVIYETGLPDRSKAPRPLRQKLWPL